MGRCAPGRLLVDPDRPFVAVVGGAKVADKIGVLTSLADRVDHLQLGGSMCFTFLAAAGHQVGASHLEPDLVGEAQSLLGSFDEIDLPSDLVALAPDGVLAGGSPSGSVRHFAAELPPGWQGADIGPATSLRFSETIAQAGTVLWNGPMGVFEDPRFAAGTRAIAEAMAACPGFTVAAGGETVAVLRQFQLDGAISHLSSGGGATLELVEKGDLPGLAALRRSRTAQSG
jgi:phosphoglycerate kinase